MGCSLTVLMRETGPSRVADTGQEQGEGRENEHALIRATVAKSLESLC